MARISYLVTLIVLILASPVIAQEPVNRPKSWPQPGMLTPEFLGSIRPGARTLIPVGAIEIGHSGKMLFNFERDQSKTICVGDIRRSLPDGTQVGWRECWKSSFEVTAPPSGVLELSKAGTMVFGFVHGEKGFMCAARMRAASAGAADVEAVECGEPYVWFRHIKDKKT